VTTSSGPATSPVHTGQSAEPTTGPAIEPRPAPLLRRMLAEALGTALLLAAVVGSGIAAQRLSPHDIGLQLLENSTATAAALVAIILALGPISGAHLNPVVTLADRVFGALTTRQAAAYITAQILGGAAGAVIANLMFSLPAVHASAKHRSSPGLWLGEVVATFGLLLIIFGIVRSKRPAAAPFAVGAYIGAAYWFTSSTSFANPAAALARTLTNTFTGIAPDSVLPFIGAELLGTALAVLAITTLYPQAHHTASNVALPQAAEQTESSPDTSERQVTPTSAETTA
jgi:glycerol uptake facilitator-like aquaporin